MKTLHRFPGDGRRMSISVAKRELKACGMTVNSTGWGDYRVGFADSQGEPYYTADIVDAVETGKCMAQRRDHIHVY